MTHISLEDRISNAGGAHELLYNSQGAPFSFPIAPEFTNWRDEQEAWKSSVILQDMSHHMTDLVVKGPDTYRLLSDLGINSFSSYGPMQAKQYVVCNSDGQYVGDAVITCEEDNVVHILGKPNTPNWVRYHLETGKYNAAVEHFDRPSANLSDRNLYRYQIQGPNAQALLEELNGASLPAIGFFKMGRFKIGSLPVTALNHRMSGAPGFEIWGPSHEGAEVKALIKSAGRKHGLRQIGGRLYPVTSTESGWLSAAFPAIYTGEATKGFREWLPAESFEGRASIGGSFTRGILDEMYLNPFEMGYGVMTKFDHDFCGRAALEKHSKARGRQKVRLIWNSDDALSIQASLYGDKKRRKYLEMPVANYSTFQMDEVTAEGKRVGLAFHPVYSVSSRAWISLAIIDPEHSVSGTELKVTWGESNGGSNKPSVERHDQCNVRVTVDSKAIRRD